MNYSSFELNILKWNEIQWRMFLHFFFISHYNISCAKTEFNVWKQREKELNVKSIIKQFEMRISISTTKKKKKEWKRFLFSNCDNWMTNRRYVKAKNVNIWDKTRKKLRRKCCDWNSLPNDFVLLRLFYFFFSNFSITQRKNSKIFVWNFVKCVAFQCFIYILHFWIVEIQIDAICLYHSFTLFDEMEIVFFFNHFFFYWKISSRTS